MSTRPQKADGGGGIDDFDASGPFGPISAPWTGTCTGTIFYGIEAYKRFLLSPINAILGFGAMGCSPYSLEFCSFQSRPVSSSKKFLYRGMG